MPYSASLCGYTIEKEMMKGPYVRLRCKMHWRKICHVELNQFAEAGFCPLRAGHKGSFTLLQSKVWIFPSTSKLMEMRSSDIVHKMHVLRASSFDYAVAIWSINIMTVS